MTVADDWSGAGLRSASSQCLASRPNQTTTPQADASLRFWPAPCGPSSAEQLAHLCCGRYWPRLLRAHTGSVAAGLSTTVMCGAGVFSSARCSNMGGQPTEREQTTGRWRHFYGSYSSLRSTVQCTLQRTLATLASTKRQCRCLSPFGSACLHPTASTSTRPPAQRDIVMPTPAELSTTWRLSIISSCIAFLRIAIGRLLLCFPLSFDQTNAAQVNPETSHS